MDTRLMSAMRKHLPQFAISLRDMVNIQDTSNILVDNPDRIEQFYKRLHTYIMNTDVTDIRIHVCLPNANPNSKFLEDYELLAQQGAEIYLWTHDKSITTDNVHVIIVPSRSEFVMYPFLIVSAPLYARALITWKPETRDRKIDVAIGGVLLTNPTRVRALSDQLNTALNSSK